MVFRIQKWLHYVEPFPLGLSVFWFLHFFMLVYAEYRLWITETVITWLSLAVNSILAFFTLSFLKVQIKKANPPNNKTHSSKQKVTLYNGRQTYFWAALTFSLLKNYAVCEKSWLDNEFIFHLNSSALCFKPIIQVFILIFHDKHSYPSIHPYNLSHS